ncbi:MAG: DUF1365 domain-containing protein [Verrucomicrobiia bacterium]
MSNQTSCLYECRVMHHRRSPVEHRFEHQIFMLWLDLDELDDLTERSFLFGHNRKRIYELRDSDHLAGDGLGIKEALMDYLVKEGVEIAPDDRVCLLTFPRVAGYAFNPVSFYIVQRRAGAAVCAVAEVGNTFGEKKRYLIPITEQNRRDEFEILVPKHFYVSPFSELDVKFNFRLNQPGERIAFHVDDYEAGSCILRTSLTGKRRAMTDRQLFWFTLRYPLLTLKVIFLIHWHALRLWFKKVPYLKKSAQPELQRDVIPARSQL